MIRPQAKLTEFGFRMLKQQQWKTEDSQHRKSTKNNWRIYIKAEGKTVQVKNVMRQKTQKGQVYLRMRN